MTTVNIKTQSAESVWKSPDGKIEMFDISLETNGKNATAKTYSKKVATVGFEGEVETYKKPDRHGAQQTFLKLPVNENYQSNNRGYGKKPSYQPKDEKAIKAMWAIGQAVAIATAKNNAQAYDTIEEQAKDLFLMVDRVKGEEEHQESKPQEEETVLEDIDDKTDISEIPF